MARLVEDLSNIVLVEEDFNKDIKVGYRVGSIEYLGHDNKSNSCNKQYYLKCHEKALDSELFKNAVFLVDRKVVKNMKIEKGRRNFHKWQFEVLVNRKCKERGYLFSGFVGDPSIILSGTKLILHCVECGHDWETTSVSKFLDCGRGCPSCGGNISYLTYNGFIREAKDKHKELYDYSLIPNSDDTILTRDKLPVKCHEHGVWYVDYHHHVQRGSGCPDPECCWKKISEVKASNTEDFVNKAIVIHGNKFDYSETVYDRSFKKLEIYCPKCEEYFLQTPSDHLNGCGCPYCAGDRQLQCYIFVISEDINPLGFKFGIANRFESRLSRQKTRSRYNVDILGVWEFCDTYTCKECERYIKQNFSCSYFTKEDYPDGYQETLPIREMDNIIKVYEDFGGIRLV